jgi:cobalt-precorrin 5A hydrolase
LTIYIISFTDKGDLLNEKMCEILDVFDVRACFQKTRSESLVKWTEKAFSDGDAIIFISAVGIAVRAISGFIKNKETDPAVIVCDELGKYAVPILSGHVGGANALAEKICRYTKGIPIITTATDINGVWAVDCWAVKKSFKIRNICNVKHISSALLKGEKVGLVSDVIIDDELPYNILLGNSGTERGIVVSPYLRDVYKYNLNLIPKCMAIGVGSRKGTDENALIELFDEVFRENNIDRYSVYTMATIDLKKNEKAIIKLREYLGIELRYYSTKELNCISGEFSSSEFVKKVTGTDNVCERCAVLASGFGKLVIKKTVGDGVTLAVGFNDTVGGIKFLQ